MSECKEKMWLTITNSCRCYSAPPLHHRLLNCAPFSLSLTTRFHFYSKIHNHLRKLSSGNSLFRPPMEGFFTRAGVDKNKVMIESLKRYGVFNSNKVGEVMEKLDRGLFVPEGAYPYTDSPMDIGYNATISAPHMHATCLQLLEDNLKPGKRALDVGSGTGYLTACFALMVGPEGRAVGVEHIPALVASSIKKIKKSAAASLLEEGSLSVHVGDGRLGWPEFAPYDAIHVGAAASEIPPALVEQLKPGGRMVIPVGSFFQDLEVIDKKADGSISVHSVTSVRYVPLTSREAQLQGLLYSIKECIKSTK